jgi:hypothetical protein
MLLRAFFLSLLFAASLLPSGVHAATVDFFGPIVPEACRCDSVSVEGTSQTTVSAPAYGCVLQVVQNVIRFAVTLGLVLALLALIYAGFVWMTSRGNPERISQGKTMLLNVIIGLVVLLSAWLIVDFIMKTLYREPTDFGPWNTILADTSGRACLQAKDPQGLISGRVGVTTSNLPGGSGGGGGNSGGTGNTLPGTPPASARCSGLRESDLRVIDNRGNKLHHEAAARFERMRAAAARDNVRLVVREGYRPIANTESIYRRRGCVTNPQRCRGLAARPCSLGGNGSNHARGTAIDIDSGASSGNWLTWMRNNGCQYGFCHSPTWNADWVHWSDTGR